MILAESSIGDRTGLISKVSAAGSEPFWSISNNTVAGLQPDHKHTMTFGNYFDLPGDVNTYLATPQ